MQGMLSIGAAMLGSSHVIGLDVDADAIETAISNVEEFEDLSIGAQQHLHQHNWHLTIQQSQSTLVDVPIRTLLHEQSSDGDQFSTSEGSADRIDSAGEIASHLKR